MKRIALLCLVLAGPALAAPPTPHPPETLQRYLAEGWEIKGYSVYYSAFPQSMFLLQKQTQVMECNRSFTENALTCRSIGSAAIKKQ
jgi:hypothetical protein